MVRNGNHLRSTCCQHPELMNKRFPLESGLHERKSLGSFLFKFSRKFNWEILILKAFRLFLNLHLNLWGITKKFLHRTMMIRNIRHLLLISQSSDGCKFQPSRRIITIDLLLITHQPCDSCLSLLSLTCGRHYLCLHFVPEILLFHFLFCIRAVLCGAYVIWVVRLLHSKLPFTVSLPLRTGVRNNEMHGKAVRFKPTEDHEKLVHWIIKARLIENLKSRIM